MFSELVLNPSSILPSMLVGPMISSCTAMMCLRMIASPQSPPTSAASEKFRKKHASGWASTHSTLSCLATRQIPRGGIRFVRWAGTRPTTLHKIRSTNMVDGNAYLVFSILVTCLTNAQVSRSHRCCHSVLWHRPDRHAWINHVSFGRTPRPRLA